MAISIVTYQNEPIPLHYKQKNRNTKSSTTKVTTSEKSASKARRRRSLSKKSDCTRSKLDKRRKSAQHTTRKKKLVKFCRSIVTDIREIPVTAPQNISDYFYSQEDIDMFREKAEQREKNKICCQRRKTTNFAPEVVSDIVYFPPLSRDWYSKLYYSVDELESMLDDFIREEMKHEELFD